ncbi:MAG TPA: acetyl-CoA C-acyltransferase, partial [Candidatus Limnocylindrales bacterium]|nr:acetyl-CoA C-acyltransferase [Candidatus Limnocylindrales bacterium]
MTPAAPKQSNDPVILASARTPVGKFLGGLSGLSAAELGQVAARAAVERSGVEPADISEIILGNVVAAGTGQALPRQVGIGAGLPVTVGGFTVNKVCGSALKAVMLASNAIKTGDGDLYLAGGAESMSRAPFLDPTPRFGQKYGHVQLLDSLQTDGL